MNISPEFTRPLDLEKKTKREEWQIFSASPEECEKLARRYGVVSLENVSGRYRVIHPEKEMPLLRRLDVFFEAIAVQYCRVSLEEVEEKIENNFSIQLILPKSARAKVENKEIDFDFEEDDREILSSSEIDVGEYVAQYLSLSLSPYPRSAVAKGDELGHQILQEDDNSLNKGKDNPFNVLKKLKH